MDGFPNEGDANNARSASNAINSRITSNSSNLSNECNSIKWRYKFPCFVNGISRNYLLRYFYGRNDTSDKSNTANSR